ncbi:MAG: MFS transporter [Acidobacteriota bacterium]|nr:MFS transporter [Acidobacteriota bacterium]
MAVGPDRLSPTSAPGAAKPGEVSPASAHPPGRSIGRTHLGFAFKRIEHVLGGPARSRVIALFAATLALSSADSSTVGASARELRAALGISNGDIGLLVSVSQGVGALAGIPFGMLVDRVNRTRLLAVMIGLWGLIMLASASVTSFASLLLVRIGLGFVTGAASPSVASLVGDYFASDERGRIYSYVLTGELLGAGVGFFITGDVAAISWRAAFVILAVPAFLLAWQVHRLPEPARGGVTQIESGAESLDHLEEARPDPGATSSTDQARLTETQRRALDTGVAPDPAMILSSDPQQLGLLAAARYILGIRTNVVLIVSGAAAYFFMTGIQTFGLEFVNRQYGVSTVLANLLMLVIGAGAVLGVIVGGNAGDALTRRGRINGRMLVAGVAATATVGLFVPAAFTHDPMTALPYITAAAFCLAAQNPTLDAARLDIMPPTLWGRAEGVRTLLRAGAQSIAPLTFGGLSDLLSGTHQGLRYTFIIMLVPLAASGLILLRGLRYYPTDVATAAASNAAHRRAGQPGQP